MLLPSKVTSFKESDLYSAFLIARQLRGKKTIPIALIKGLRVDQGSKSVDLASIIYALKILYILHLIEFDNGGVAYVG